MAEVTNAELLAWMRGHRLAVVSTLGLAGHPQAALVGIAVTDDFAIVFDTVATSRKHIGLAADPRAAVTFSGPAEQTLQLEAAAFAVSATDPGDAPWREAYFQAWPECRGHLAWPNIAYWRLRPRWLRFSDYDRGPLIFERTFGE